MEYNAKQQRSYCEYAHQRDFAIGKTFEFGFKELHQLFLHFPSRLFNPWCPSPSRSANDDDVDAGEED